MLQKFFWLLYLLYVHPRGWLKPNVTDGGGLLLQQEAELILVNALLPNAPQNCKPIIGTHLHGIPKSKRQIHMLLVQLLGQHYKFTTSMRAYAYP